MGPDSLSGLGLTGALVLIANLEMQVSNDHKSSPDIRRVIQSFNIGLTRAWVLREFPILPRLIILSRDASGRELSRY